MPVAPIRVPTQVPPLPPLLAPNLVPPLVPPAPTVVQQDPPPTVDAPPPPLNPPLAPEQTSRTSSPFNYLPWYDHFTGAETAAFRWIDAYFFATLSRAIWSGSGGVILPILQQRWPSLRLVRIVPDGEFMLGWDEWSMDAVPFRVLVFPPTPSVTQAIQFNGGNMILDGANGYYGAVYSAFAPYFAAYRAAVSARYNDIGVKNNAGRYVFTGMSLGGAVAQMLSYRIQQKPDRPFRWGPITTTYAFGMPAWANDWFRDFRLGGKDPGTSPARNWEVWNVGDPVPQIVQVALKGSQASWLQAFIFSAQPSDLPPTPAVPTHEGSSLVTIAADPADVRRLLDAINSGSAWSWDYWQNTIGTLVEAHMASAYTNALRWKTAQIRDVPYPEYNYLVQANTALDQFGM